MFKRIFPRDLRSGGEGLGDLYATYLEQGGTLSYEDFIKVLMETRNRELSIQIYGRSISKGFIAPGINGYSPRYFGKKLQNRYTLKKVIYQTNTPRNKMIRIQTTDGDEIYSFLADSNKDILITEDIVIDSDKSINVFVDGPDNIINTFKLDLELRLLE